MESSSEDIQKHVKTYLMVGATLLVFTGVTVLVRTRPFLILGFPVWMRLTLRLAW